jgi:tRNA-Thr(GGU) m(6)t(6)A37 methyltransferase TsaA
MMRRGVPAIAAILAVAIVSAGVRQIVKAEQSPGTPERRFTLHPIGSVAATEQETTIVLDKKYQPGLLGLDGFSHIWVFWWFDRNDTPQQRAVLQVHPRGNPDNPLSGVFATRSPVRPNLIALTLCRVVSVRGNVVRVEKIDAFDGTPVLDIKPYIPPDATTATVPAWLKQGPPEKGQ